MLVLKVLALFLWLFHDPGAAPPGSKPQPPAADATPIGADGIIGLENRKLVTEFSIPGAADQTAVRAGLAATQRLSCGASASLIYRSDVIIFSAHQLLDDGKPDPALAHCFFVVSRMVEGGEPKEERYPLLLATLDHGVLKGSAASVDDSWNADNERDWSVVRLARPVAGITPYRLPDEDRPGPPGAAVATVSDTTENWTGSSKPTDRLAQTCHAIAADASLTRRFPDVMHLDCDVGRGASGGAIVDDVASGTPRYLGTIIAYSGNLCSVTGFDICFSIGRRLDPELASRVRGTSALGSGPLYAADRAAQQARLASARDEVAAMTVAELGKPFPIQGDAVGRDVATLQVRIENMVKEGRAAQSDALFLQAYRELHDPDQRRPEWRRLWLENGEALLRQDRRTDAYVCFKAAYAVADEALKPYLQLRMAMTAPDADERRQDLREAYLAGGEALFRAAGAETDLAAVTAQGLPTTPEPGDSDD